MSGAIILIVEVATMLKTGWSSFSRILTITTAPGALMAVVNSLLLLQTPCHCIPTWGVNASSLLLFLLWMNVIFFLRSWPNEVIGLYISMFLKVFHTFFKLALVAVLLLLTFSFSFFIIFHEFHHNQVSFWCGQMLHTYT